MTPVFLISSAAYVEAELAAEFGELPPAFLPLGNRRLYYHQRMTLGPAPARLLLSLPADFEPEPHELRHLGELGIEVVKVPLGLTLGESLIYVINVTASAGGRFSVLHGDTLIRDIDWTQTDIVSVTSTAPPGYHWGYITNDSGTLSRAQEDRGSAAAVALTGFFAFGDTSLLVQTVTQADGDFVQGLIKYSEHKAMRTVTAGAWHDFGHASTYHLSRQIVTTERAFNNLIFGPRTVTKSGAHSAKIDAEAQWYEHLPRELSLFSPLYIGRSNTVPAHSYITEYLYLPSLADLFVFGRLSDRSWDQIFSGCDEFLSICAMYGAAGEDPNADALYLEKTLRRLERFSEASGVSLSEPCRLDGDALPSLEQMARIAASAIAPASATEATLVHGDFCFSNIFYDFRSRRIRVIDPRGLDGNGRVSAFGDRRYDIAKLYHSVGGKYDMIIARHFRLDRNGALDFSLSLPESASMRAAHDAFNDRAYGGLRPAAAAAHPISILLFLSMLPLHSDDPERQLALLANAMRLFRQLDVGGAS